MDVWIPTIPPPVSRPPLLRQKYHADSIQMTAAKLLPPQQTALHLSSVTEARRVCCTQPLLQDLVSPIFILMVIYKNHSHVHTEG